ncbi:unnamed protein product [Rhizophagus irregularis]|nr:unnamed protein product [Rhizophagus irregularis]
MSKSSEAGKIEILKEYALIYLSQLSIIYEVVNQLPSFGSLKVDLISTISTPSECDLNIINSLKAILILRFEEDILCWKSYKEGRLSISWVIFSVIA